MRLKTCRSNTVIRSPMSFSCVRHATNATKYRRVSITSHPIFTKTIHKSSKKAKKSESIPKYLGIFIPIFFIIFNFVHVFIENVFLTNFKRILFHIMNFFVTYAKVFIFWNFLIFSNYIFIPYLHCDLSYQNVSKLWSKWIRHYLKTRVFLGI